MTVTLANGENLRHNELAQNLLPPKSQHSKEQAEKIKILYRQGMELVKTLTFEEAKKIFKEILTLNPEDSKANAALGGCYFLLGEIGKAKILLFKNHLRDKSDISTLNFLSDIFYSEDDPDKAIRTAIMSKDIENPDNNTFTATYRD